MLPFFSIIVCTRNRPDILKYCLQALQNQAFKDFEVILSDNSDAKIKAKNYKTVKGMHFDLLQYVTPDSVLSMHENYNFAINQASGKYIGVLTDKNLLKENALLDLYNFLKNTQVDIINYHHTGCHWYPDKLFKWVASETDQGQSHFEPYEPKDELLRRFSLKNNLKNEGIEYNFGKIFFGFYRRSLVDQLKKKYQDVFHALFSDYTSTVLALDLATSAVFYHKKIMVTINSYAGNGLKAMAVPGGMMDFIKTCLQDVPTLLNNIPIPNVYSLHNFCAYDYQILNRFGNHHYQINMNNLAQRVYEDLQVLPFESEAEKESLYDSFYKFLEEKKISINMDSEEIQKEASFSEPPNKKSLTQRMVHLLFFRKNKLAFIFLSLSNRRLNLSRYKINLSSLLK